MKKSIIFAASAITVLTMISCGNTKESEAIDDAKDKVEEVGEQVKDASEKLEDKAEKWGKKLKE